MWGIMFTQGAALGYVIVGLSARLRPHYQFYRTAIVLYATVGFLHSFQRIIFAYNPKNVA